MQQIFVDDAGNEWLVEVDAQGNPIESTARPANQQPQMPADPSFAYEGQRAAAQARDAQNKANASELDKRLAQLEAREREAKIAELEQKLGEGADEAATFEQAQAAKSIRQRLSTGNILQSIRDARALARQGGTGFGSLASPIPTTTARDLENAIKPILATLAFDRLQQMRDESKTGGALGQVSERELDLLQSAVSSLDTGQSLDAFLANLDKIEKHFVGSQLALSGVEPDSEEGQVYFEQYGITSGIQNGSPPSGTPDLNPEDYRLGIQERFATEQDQRHAAYIQSLFDRGASAQELNAANREFGYPEFAPEQLEEAIKFREAGGEGINVQAPESGYRDPSILDRGINAVGQTPVGSYFTGAANALTLGSLDEVQGIMAGDSLSDAFAGRGVNTNLANLKKGLQAEKNPASNVIGNISGGILGALATRGGGPAAGGMSALAPRFLATDAALGAAYGAGENNSDRLGGAIEGGVAAAAGGALGRKAVSSTANLLGGVSGPAQVLRREGVTLTPGQIGESKGGLFGRMAKRREDRLSGYSGIGDAIGQAQERGFQDFNRAAFRNGLRETPPAIGEEGIQYAQETVVPRAFSRALDNQNFSVDAPLEDALSTSLARARRVGGLESEVPYHLESSFAPFVGEAGDISGRNFQNISQELQRRASKLDKSMASTGPDGAAILRDTRDELGNMVTRQSPDVMPAYREANDIYRNSKILEDAVYRAKNTGGVFTPAQLGLSAGQNAKKYGGTHATPERPFYDLQRAAQDLLPSKIPDSGTAGRAAAGDGIIGTVKGAARNLRMPMYDPKVLEMVNQMLLDRPDTFKKAGELLRGGSRYGGVLGAPTGAVVVNY